MDLTPRLSLKKPSNVGEVMDITDLNDNADKLDEQIGYYLCTNASRPAAPFVGMQILETDTGNKYYRAASNEWFGVGVLNCLSSARPTPVRTGQEIYETNTKQAYYWDGTYWVWIAGTSFQIWSKAATQSIAAGVTATISGLTTNSGGTGSVPLDDGITFTLPKGVWMISAQCDASVANVIELQLYTPATTAILGTTLLRTSGEKYRISAVLASAGSTNVQARIYNVGASTYAVGNCNIEFYRVGSREV